MTAANTMMAMYMVLLGLCFVRGNQIYERRVTTEVASVVMVGWGCLIHMVDCWTKSPPWHWGDFFFALSLTIALAVRTKMAWVRPHFVDRRRGGDSAFCKLTRSNMHVE